MRLLIGAIALLSRFIPKNKRVWIFGSRFGLRYDENSKYLFEYVNKVAPDIRAIWLTKNQAVYEYLKKRGYEVYKAYSFKGYLYTIFAGAAIISVSKGDINNRVLGKSPVIQLWHGTPLKKVDPSDRKPMTINVKKNAIRSLHAWFHSLIYGKVNSGQY